MFRTLLVAAVAACTLGAASLTATAPAEARSVGTLYNLPRGGGGWHGGGGWRGGGGGWGGRHWGGGGWGGGGRRWYGGGYGRRWGGGGWGWGGGLALAPLLLAPGLYGNNYYGNSYYDDDYYDYGPVCRWRRVRIQTYYGWRIGRQRICY